MTDPKDNGMLQNGNAGSGYNAGGPGTYPGPAQNTDPSIGMVVGFGSEDASGMIGMMGMMSMMSMMNQSPTNPGAGPAPVAGAVPPAGSANNMNNGLQSNQVLPPGHWRCKNCGTVSGGKFCPECGKPGPWKCVKCGTMATGNFCPECGSGRP